jgi:L-amino acid N-acyltransferase YncA
VSNHSEIGFRLAAEDDWPAIFRIFKAVTATENTYPFPPDVTESEARDLWMAPTKTVFVATVGDGLVGTAYVTPNLPGLGDHIANAGWMVHPDDQGKGIGRPFAVYVIAEARAAGFRGMQFNAVVATNTGAIALWESLGFAIVGTVPDAFRHSTNGLTAIHIMYREL